MTPRLQALQVVWFKAAAALEAGVREEFTTGKRISYLDRGNNRIGVVIGHTGHYDEIAIQVRAERTGEIVSVRLCQQPEVIA